MLEKICVHFACNFFFSTFPSVGEVEFSLDMTRSLLAMVDRDHSGTLDYYEFEPLVFSLQRWVVRHAWSQLLICPQPSQGMMGVSRFRLYISVPSAISGDGGVRVRLKCATIPLMGQWEFSVF